jgi:hypothetical protein
LEEGVGVLALFGDLLIKAAPTPFVEVEVGALVI